MTRSHTPPAALLLLINAREAVCARLRRHPDIRDRMLRLGLYRALW